MRVLTWRRSRDGRTCSSFASAWALLSATRSTALAELDFREGYSFTYAVYDANGAYLGCCYLYPLGRRTPLTAEMLEHDVDVSWWVTPEAYRRGYYK